MNPVQVKLFLLALVAASLVIGVIAAAVTLVVMTIRNKRESKKK